MQKLAAICTWVVITFIAVPAVEADSWAPIKTTEFASPGGKHLLKLAPSSDPQQPGHCLATLFKIDGRKRTTIWSRHLINNLAPVKVYVSDSGKYVVTMDEWGRVGELPVVVYGSNGELIKVHSTDSLSLKDDVSHIQQTISSYWWNEDAISFFDTSEDRFLIRLHWGKWIVLNLGDGELYPGGQAFSREGQGKARDEAWQQLDELKRRKLAELALAMLVSKDAKQRKTGALVCGQERISEAVPALKNLLSDHEYLTTNVPKEWTKVYYVRKAAKDALELLGQKIEAITVEEPYSR